MYGNYKENSGASSSVPYREVYYTCVHCPYLGGFSVCGLAYRYEFCHRAWYYLVGSCCIP